MSEPQAPDKFRSSGAEKDTGPQRLLRLGFLLLLAGGLVLWTQLRKPRPLAVELDLTRSLPGDLSEVDLIVTRSDRLLVRKDLRFESGAPQTLREELQATPGAAELQVDLVYRAHPATRTRASITLSADAPVRIQTEPAQ